MCMLYQIWTFHSKKKEKKRSFFKYLSFLILNLIKFLKIELNVVNPYNSNFVFLGGGGGQDFG